jgi:hypothetical protein
MFVQNSGAPRREKAESRSQIVMPRFKRGIQYAVMSRIMTNRLWNTGSPGHLV